MTTVDILFWLLIALLGGGAWAIEAGIASKHRRVLLCSTMSALGAAMFIMFWIEDNSKLDLGERAVFRRKGGGNGEAAEEANEEPSSKAKAPAAATTSEKSTPSGKKKTDDEDDGKTEYSKEPFRDCKLCPNLVIVPAGTAQVGSPTNEPGRLRSEQTAASITIQQPFAVGKLELLREEFAAFVKETNYEPAADCNIGVKRQGRFNWQTPGFEQDGRHPVVCISWRDAMAYVNWLKATTGRGYKLLNEAEWEYAARSGTKTPYWQGDDLPSSHANFGRSRDGTIPGGSMQANKFGINDVSGNVWEMLSECEQTSLGRLPGDTGTASGAQQSACSGRIIKGGSWNSSIGLLRHAARAGVSETWASNAVGFRVGREIDDRDNDKILTPAEKAAIKAADRASAAIDAKAKADAEKAERERIAAEEKAAADAAAAAAGEKK